MRIQDIMKKGVKTVSPSTKAEAAFQRMTRNEYHHLVVVDDGKPVGVLSERDLGGRRGASLRKNKLVSDLMSRTMITVRPDTTVRQAANQLRGHNIGCLPVIEEGKLKGIVTITDFLDLIGRGIEKPIAEPKKPTMMRDKGKR